MLPSSSASGCWLVVAAATWSSFSGYSPTLALRLTSLPLRQTTTGTDLPTGVSATMAGKERMRLISLPSKERMMSPGWMPAFLAGLLSLKLATSAPRAGLKPKFSAISSVTVWM